jgi:hypothetical protein
MEWADEPPPLNLLYRAEIVWVVNASEWMRDEAWGKRREKGKGIIKKQHNKIKPTHLTTTAADT